MKIGMKKRGRSRIWLGAALAALMSFASTPGAAQADSGRRCSGGYAAITFDDGPTDSTTAYLIGAA
ncbi:hypothetical protein ACWEFL_08485 [Streptomyces sp. NPDC004838]